MSTRKLTLEISESLFQQLEHLAEATEQSTESLAIRMIASKIPSVAREVQELDELLAGITPDNLHGEIDFGEPVGHEIF